MEQRQRGHQPVGGGQLHPVRETLTRHGVGAVGLHDQLRLPRGARGRDQDRDVAVADAGPQGGRRAGRVRGLGARPAVGQLTGVQDPEPGQAGDARLGDQRVEAGIGDDGTGAGLVREPGQLGRGAARVGGDGDRADRGEGQPAQQVRRGGPERDHNQVAVTHPRLAQGPGGGRRLRQRSAEAHGPLVAADPDAVAVTAGRVGEHLGDRPVGRGPVSHGYDDTARMPAGMR